jgi:hypothetical protein
MERSPLAPQVRHARRLVLTAVSLCVLLAASTPMATAFDPTRPVNNKETPPPSTGDPGDGGGDPIPAPREKVALGVATPDGRSMAELDSFSASIGGRRPAIWVIWSQWGHPNQSAFPRTTADALRDRGVTPMIWWEPVNPTNLSDGTYSRYKIINAGTHDAYVRQYARDAKAFGGKVLLRFAHEINNNYFPWSINSFDNTPENFIAAWRRVHGIFQDEGATNVKFVWSVAKETCSGCNPYARVYPGDAWVDVMGFSAYNWGAAKQWISMHQSYQRVTQLLSEISSKPIMAAETASNSEGGDKAAWIRDGYLEVYEKLPRVRAIVYLNADLRDVGHPDWRIASPKAALAAYAEISAMTEFSAASPFSARTDTKATLGVKRKAGDGKPSAKTIRGKHQAKRATVKLSKGNLAGKSAKGDPRRKSKSRQGYQVSLPPRAPAPTPPPEEDPPEDPGSGASDGVEGAPEA